MKRLGILFLGIFCVLNFIACEAIYDRDKDKCKVPTKVSKKHIAFSNSGGEEFIEVNPKPYYIIQRITIGKVGDEGYSYQEKQLDSYSTANYSVQKISDGRLLIKVNPYYGEKSLKFEIEVKGGDCSSTIYGTINP